jgi:hypothetical protein
VLQLPDGIADTLVRGNGNRSACCQRGSQRQRGEGDPALGTAPGGQLVDGRCGRSGCRLGGSCAGNRGRHQRSHRGGGLRLLGSEAAEPFQCGLEHGVVVESRLTEQSVNRSVVAGACGVSHDLPGFC